MKKLIISAVAFIVVMAVIIYSSFITQDAEALNEVGSNINLYAVIAAFAIVAISFGVVLKYVNQMQNDTATGEDSGHEWDGIREFKNDIPKGWAIMYIALIVWFIYYLLVAFPVGTYSQLGEYNDEVNAHKEKFEKEHANLNKEQLTEMGESVFSVNCAPCHGFVGDGQGGLAADLNKRTLTKSYVKHIATNGSNQLGFGFMSGKDGLFNANTNKMISDKEIDAVATYVSNGFKGKEGADVFAGTCSGCHGTGEGIPFAGPSLKAYNIELVTDILLNGSKKGEIGKMPAFKGRLTNTQIKAVATYVETLAN